MRNGGVELRRSPMGEGGGGLGVGEGGSLGGSGVPISPGGGGGTGSSTSGGPKLPNAISPAPAAAAGAATPAGDAKPRIHGFSTAMGVKKHAENWKRKTNLTGTGATHMRTFHCKLNSESVEYMDQQINEWLDNHPDYEVKMVTTAIGEWTGKIKEPAMVVTVWV